jgi:serine/threonine protein kinase
MRLPIFQAFAQLLVLTFVCCKTIQSPANQYHVCETDYDIDDTVDVLRVVRYSRNGAKLPFGDICAGSAPKNPDFSLATLRCLKPNADSTPLENEIAKTMELSNSAWSMKGIESFVGRNVRGAHSALCLAVENFGDNIAQVRTTQVFRPETLGSVGLQMIDIIESLHTEYKKVHRGLSPTAWMLNKDTGRIYMANYGYMRDPKSSDEKINDLREIATTLRYLVDLDKKYMVSKRIKDRAEMLQTDIPEIGQLLQYTFDSVTSEDISTGSAYEIMRIIIGSMLGSHPFNGRIIWSSVQEHESPKVTMQVMTDKVPSHVSKPVVESKTQVIDAQVPVQQPIVKVDLPSNLIQSRSFNYAICDRFHVAETAYVYKALMYPREVVLDRSVVDKICRGKTDIESAKFVALKCGKGVDEIIDSDIVSEYQNIELMRESSWSVRGYEFFGALNLKSKLVPCYSMELLGKSIRDIREKRGEPFSLATLASIGIGMMNILEELHERYKRVHTDLHGANWMVDLQDETKLKLIDYGNMKLTETRAHHCSSMVY